MAEFPCPYDMLSQVVVPFEGRDIVITGTLRFPEELKNINKPCLIREYLNQGYLVIRGTCERCGRTVVYNAVLIKPKEK